MKNNLRKIIVWIIVILILGWIGYYVKNHWTDFSGIKIYSYFYFALLVIAMPVYFFSQAILLKFILEPFDIRLKFKEWFGLTLITMMGNFIIPFSGLGFRSIYLKKVHHFDYRHFISTLSAIWAVNFLVFTIAGIVVLLTKQLRTGTTDIALLIFLVIIFLGCLLIILVPFRPFKTSNRYLEKINLFLESWKKVKTNRHLIWQLFYWSVIELILYAATFYFAFKTFNFPISFFNCLLPASLADFSLFLRLLPGSFGVYEGAIIFSVKALGLSIAQGLTVTALTRLVNFFWVFSLGFFFSLILSRKQKES